MENHAILWKFNPVAEKQFSFQEFLQLVFQGDVSVLMSRSQYAMASSVYGDLDPAFEDPLKRLRFAGDPVKFAMTHQILRNLPALSAIVPVLFFSLLIASMVKLVLPFIRRWPTFIGNLIPDDEEEFDKFQSRDKRHAPEKIVVPRDLIKVGERLESTLSSGLNFLNISDHTDSESIRYEKKRSIKFAGYEQRKARLQLGEMTELSEIFKSWLQAWVRILPNIASCVGQIIGCHVVFGYWGNVCKPVAPMAVCISILGFSLESLGRFSYPF